MMNLNSLNVKINIAKQENNPNHIMVDEKEKIKNEIGILPMKFL